jgi:steroid delta-isomerase-like uncharacterized protein
VIVADAKQVLNEMLSAMEARDMQRVLATLAEDVSFETEMLPTPIRGKQAVREMMRDGFNVYESIRIERKMVIGEGREVAALLSLRVRFDKDLHMMGESLPTAGKELNVMGAVFGEVDESGRLSRVMRVRDTLGVVQQLGLSPDRINALTQKLQERMQQPPSRAA